MKYLLFLVLIVATVTSNANPKDPSIFYIQQGKAVHPWELSLNFGKAQLVESQASTVRKSLSVEQTDTHVSFVWEPKRIKNQWGSVDRNILTVNLLNRQQEINISSVVNQAAMYIKFRVMRKPQDLVDLTLECSWNWKCRTTFPLKQLLRSVDTSTWYTVPIPLVCFDNENFDFSKVTGMMLVTEGRLSLDVEDVYLGAVPNDFSGC